MLPWAYLQEYSDKPLLDYVAGFILCNTDVCLSFADTNRSSQIAKIDIDIRKKMLYYNLTA